jgi:hypothetical protein
LVTNYISALLPSLPSGFSHILGERRGEQLKMSEENELHATGRREVANVAHTSMSRQNASVFEREALRYFLQIWNDT